MRTGAKKRRQNGFKEKRGTHTRVEIRDENSVYIDDGVQIAAGAVIWPNNHLYGNTSVAAGAVIGPNNVIYDSAIGENCNILASVLKGAKLGRNVSVGPNAYLRENSSIGDDCRVGDFVEIKNAVIGAGTKIAHLTYIGDADVGKNCNFGCGVVFANYDGKNKYRTTVGDECFIGSNCNLVAPLNVESGAFVAAGTTVTREVKKETFVIGRVKQQESETLKKRFIPWRKKGEKHA